eukprot:960109-Pelagomonas_calceolata.AAC.1
MRMWILAQRTTWQFTHVDTLLLQIREREAATVRAHQTPPTQYHPPPAAGAAAPLPWQGRTREELWRTYKQQAQTKTAELERTR